MKQIAFLCALFVITFTSAQSTLENAAKIGTIKGHVVDAATQEPIPYATVVIKNKSAEKTITGGITNDEGNFTIENLPAGDLIIEVQFIGYKTYHHNLTITESSKTKDLGNIVLSEDVSELNQVDVVGERSTIEQKVDRKVINVGKDLTTAGATASDIMNNIPSVNVDQQTGAISLRGNSNVRVMVDGKLSNVPVDQLLKQIPSTSIKKIELITNPSAKYNPEGMSGIINIVLVKNANIGFNGNVNLGATYGIKPKYNGSLDMNYRNGKVNLYGSYGINDTKRIHGGNIYQEQQDTRQIFDFESDNNSNLYKVGIDYYINDKNTLSAFTNQNIFKGDFGGNVGIFYGNGTPTGMQDFNTHDNNNSGQYNLDFKHDFDKEGHNIELEIDYNKYSGDQNATYLYSGSFENRSDYEDYSDTNRNQTTINLDYVNPLSENTKLEAGAEARLYGTDLKYKSTGESYNAAGELVPTPSTNFGYNQDIYSIYATFGQTLGKFSYQIGARIEHVNIDADTSNVAIYSDKYFQVYPSAFLTYKPTDKNQYQISVSKRVDRPGLEQVNPVRSWSTPQITELGNPELKPQFTNSVELNYTRQLKKGSVTAGVFYRFVKDEINDVLYVDRLDPENKQIKSYANFDDTNAVGVEVSGNYRPTKWWGLNGSFDMYSQQQSSYSEYYNFDDSSIETDNVEINNLAYNIRLSNSITATKKLTFQVFGMFRGPNQSLQFKSKSMFFVNTGARYAFAKGKASLSLNYNDIFNTMGARFTTDRPYRQVGNFDWESHTFYVGLSYRFGNSKYKAAKRKQRDDNTTQGGGAF
ncbi:TonB-dependent receptor domain-containing protein [Zhouia sp. PK063]|uniref:TonB-dependent receptor domain-containing protein n=1 Tax=Zhouia sp. PK063 TaxID=3373602 RepID=UPI003798E676